MPWLPKNCVVVPVDFSDQSFAAVDSALEFVADPSHLRVVHVLPVLPPGEPGVIWDDLSDSARCDHAVKVLRERLAGARYAGVKVAALVGDPGHQVADYASGQKADLIVLPSHGRTGISRLLIGSVAERVVRLAHCPVLVLRS